MNNVRSFEYTPAQGYTSLRLFGELKVESVKDFEQETANIISTYASHIIANCENVSMISSGWMRALVQLKKQLKTINKDIQYLGMSTAIQKNLKDQGVINAFPSAPTLRAALVDFGLATPRSLDVNFINPFLNATMNVLKVQASTEARPGQIYKKPANEKFYGDISGVIALVSEGFSGAIVISFPEETFLKIMGNMLGETFESLTKEIEDGAGELTNIIFGQAKIELNENGFGIKTAIPSVVSGKDHTVQNMLRGQRVAIPFESVAGKFLVEICLTD